MSQEVEVVHVTNKWLYDLRLRKIDTDKVLKSGVWTRLRCQVISEGSTSEAYEIGRREATETLKKKCDKE